MGAAGMICRMSKKPQAPPRTFEDALAELEKILADIEAGEVGLEESLVKFERGNFLIQHCRTVLSSAEKRIELLSQGQGSGGGAGGGSGLKREPIDEEAL
jgi:exodeoxyribonuclease VII small subunit